MKSETPTEARACSSMAHRRRKLAYRQRKAREVWSALRAYNPAVFSPENPLPLKIGVHLDIEERHVGRFGRHKIMKFFHWWTRRQAYLEALRTALFRYDLEGNEHELLDEHRLIRKRKAPVSSEAPEALGKASVNRGDTL